MSRTPKTNHVYCPHCGSNNEPFFSRSVPMGFYCRDCGKDVDEKQSDQTMSDTPNTRAVIQAADGRWTYSIKNFCESMERKLTKLQRERDEAREQCDRLAEALDRLERTAGLAALQDDPARVQARQALAAVKGGDL
jgi:DNA-directed RNA polymerase subunit RPC12/RpoP